MKAIYVPLLFIALLFIADKAFAQTDPNDILDKLDQDSKDKVPEKTSSFKVSVDFLSNNVFMGRADTVSTPAILPELKYTFSNGIYLSAGVNYIPNRLTNKLDAGSLALGYDYDITEDLSGSVSFTKLFYSANSTQIGSAITGIVGANLDYDISGIITPTVGLNYNFVKQGFGNDIFVSAGLSHDFAKEGIFGDDDLFIISPAATINSGTQNFYDAYLVTKKYKLTAKGQAKEAAAEKLLIKQKEKLSRFSLLDYELSAPVEYKTGKLILSFTPTYAQSENKLPPRITSGMVKSGIFFFEAGAALKF
jgi:hypothetical protein